MILKAPFTFMKNQNSFDNCFKKIELSIYSIERLLYSQVLSITRNIHEVSGLILEINDLKLVLDLHEFEGQF